MKSIQRRAQIVRVTLELLGNTPVEKLTTRQIANELDISQPALFRHFRSREELLLAVMSSARAELSAVAGTVLDNASDPVERLRLLAERLLTHVELYPGLARLLFAVPAEGKLRDALRRLVSMQRSLIAQFIRDGQEMGMFRPSLDAAEAATFFVGMIQGTVLRAQLAETPMRLADEVEPMLSLWLDGARPSPGAPEPPAHKPERTCDTAAPTKLLATVDARPILGSGNDPFDSIMSALDSVKRSGVLTVIAPFRPEPLIRLMGERGHGVVARPLDKGAWSVDIVVGGATNIDDLTDLEPPEPLERILEAVAALEPGQVYVARTPRKPSMLVPHLEDHDVRFQMEQAVDGTALVYVEAAP